MAIRIVPVGNIDDVVRARLGEASCEVNILVNTPKLRANDIDLFFGPASAILRDLDIFIGVEPQHDWAHILAALGCFGSKSQARKNGWRKPVESGFTPRFKVGKARRKFICALNIQD